MRRNPPALITCLAVLTLTTLTAGPALASFAGTDLFLPMAGRKPGIYPSDWYTKVWVHNPGPNPADIRIYFLERSTSNPSPPYYDDTVPAGDTRVYENIVWTLFSKEAFGALRVVSTNSQKVIANSRVYSQAAGSGETDSLGQQFAGVPAAFAIGAGDDAQVLGVHQTVPSSGSELRYNFGFVETTGSNATVRVTVWSETGQQQGSKDFGVREYSQRQVAFKDHFPSISTENARLTFQVVAGAGKIIAYGSAIANTSQDPTTFEMTYAEFLRTVTHDTSLTGDGTAASALGLADAAVTLDKLGTTNTPSISSGEGETLAAASTQILGTDGSDIFWTDMATANGFSAGGVLFGGASGDLAQDSTNLFWDANDKWLGIGTATPDDQLELTGNLRLPSESTNTAGLIRKGSSTVFHTAGTDNTFLGRAAGNLTLTGTGNTGIGQTALAANTSGARNTAVGRLALDDNTSGSYNVAVGNGTLSSNTTGANNTAVGTEAMSGNTIGANNTALGQLALTSNTEGQTNTALGGKAMQSNTTGVENTCAGFNCLGYNTTGTRNTALGYSALAANTSGSENLAAGYEALRSATTASANTALGPYAMHSTTTGDQNTAVGGLALRYNTEGSYNTAAGYDALAKNRTGNSNSALGNASLNENTTGKANTAVGASALFSNTSGSYNTAVGGATLLQSTTGEANTAVGYHALQANTVGWNNVAVGHNALWSNTSGASNTATGAGALKTNSTGQYNTANGHAALFSNSTGSYNTAAGLDTMSSNTNGSYNTAMGSAALFANTTGTNNAAFGSSALTSATGNGLSAFGAMALRNTTSGEMLSAFGNTALRDNMTGSYNSAFGNGALQKNTSGNYNTAMGSGALGSKTTGSGNSAFGDAALWGLTAGDENIAVGADAGDNLTAGSNNIYIGNEGQATESATIRIGTGGTHTLAFLAGVVGTPITGGVTVQIKADGQLGIVSASSRRYKRDIHDMGGYSEALLELRPVRFRYNADIDPEGTPQHGLIAEEVAEVMPELVVYDADGRPQMVRYHELPTLLLNELQRQHLVVADQRQRIADQDRRIAALAAQLAELQALVQDAGRR